MKTILQILILCLLSVPLLQAKDKSVELRATATPCGTAAHCVVLTWTNPTFVSGGYIAILRGTASGGESSTPINPTGTQVATFTDLNVTANATYFYVAEQCAVSVSSGSAVCSPPSNEVKAVLPLAPSDLQSVQGLSAPSVN